MLDLAGFRLVDARTGQVRTLALIASLASALEGRLSDRIGESVAIVIADKFDLATVLLAASQLAVRIVPLDPFSPAAAQSAFVSASGARTIIADHEVDTGGGSQTVITVQELLLAAEEPDRLISFPAMQSHWLFFTSGSTGSPKGVEFSSDMVRQNVRLALDALPFEPGFRTASMLPAYHTFTLIGDIMTAFALQGSCVILPDFEIAQLDFILEALATHQVQAFSGVPVIYEVMTAFADRMTGLALRFVTSGAAPLRAELVERYARLFDHPIIPCYGMTEGVCFLSISDPARVRPGSAGVPRVALRIVNHRDAPVTSGKIGNIQVRGSSVIPNGYFNNQASLKDSYADGGWFRTGDIGYLDSDGQLFITGRSKNLIIRGGKKVYLEDLEALFDAGTVAAVAHGGENREKFVFFFEAEKYDDRGVSELISGRLGIDHMPDRFIPIAQIPKSPTGKLKRQILAEGLQRGSY